MHCRRFVNALLVALIWLGTVGTPALGAETGSIGNVAMTATGADAQRKGYYELQAVGGDGRQLTFEVANPSTEAVEILVYAADAASATGGGMSALPPDVTPRRAGSWITPDQQQLQLAPQERRTITLALRVPDSVNPGQHLATVIARSFKPGEAKAAAGNQATFRIDTVSQVAIAVLINVPGPVIRQLAVTKVDHFYQGEQLYLRVQLQNDGGVIEKPFGTIRILSESGEELDVKNFKMDSLYPGTEGEMLFPMESMANHGRYTVQVEVTPEAALDAATGLTLSAAPPPVRTAVTVNLTREQVAEANEVRYQKIKEQRTDDVLVLPIRTLVMYGLGGIALLAVLAVALILFLRRRSQP